MGFLSNPSERTANDMLQLLSVHLEKAEGYLLAIGSWHIEHRETASILARFGIDLGLMTEEQKKIEPAVKNELARNQAALTNVVSETGDAIKRDILAEIRNFSTLCESFSKHEAFMKKQVADIETTQRQNNMTFAKLMEHYASSFNKTAKENIGLRDEVKRVKKALSVAEKRILDLEQDKLFPGPSPTEPYTLFDGETGEPTLVVPRQKSAPVKAPQNVEATPKETSELDEMRARIETITSKVESLAASKQPQEPPAPAPARKEDAPFIETPAPSVALPAPVVVQAKGYVPKADDLLSYPNAAQLGKKSILLLQKLASIMEGKIPPIFTRENIDDWLDITAVRTGDRYVSEWQKLGFIEKKGKSVYGFIPPPTATAPPTQPQEVAEGSQPAV